MKSLVYLCMCMCKSLLLMSLPLFFLYTIFHSFYSPHFIFTFYHLSNEWHVMVQLTVFFLSQWAIILEPLSVDSVVGLL